MIVLGMILLVGAMLDALGIVILFPFIKGIISPDALTSEPVFIYLASLFDLTFDDNQLTVLAIVAVSFFLGKNIFGLVLAYWRNRLFNFSVALEATAFLGRYLRAPHEFHLNRRTPEIFRNLNVSMPVIFKSVFVSVFEIIFEISTGIAIFVTLLLINPHITLSATGIVISILVVFGLFMPRLMKSFGRQANALDAALVRATLQPLHALKEISVLGKERFFEKAYERSASNYARVKTISGTLKDSPRYVSETILVLALVAVTFFMLDTQTSTGDLVATLGVFAAAAFRMVPSINRVIAAVSQISFARAFVDAVYSEMKALGEFTRREPANIGAPITVSRRIAFQNVSFVYPESEYPSVKDLNIEVRRGSSTAIVGASGAGKTTVINLLLGLVTPLDGQILIDDNVLDSKNLRQWQRNIGFVPQEINLIDDSLRQNVALGEKPSVVDDGRIWEILHTVQLVDFVRQLPEGLDTVLGEDGVRFSGGQRQRIGLARALYHDPGVLIFDEPTSALDHETEARITNTLNALRTHKTLFIVTHRLNTVRKCDALAFLEDGELNDFGTYDELVSRNEKFREMASMEADSLVDKEAIS